MENGLVLQRINNCFGVAAVNVVLIGGDVIQRVNGFGEAAIVIIDISNAMASIWSNDIQQTVHRVIVESSDVPIAVCDRGQIQRTLNSCSIGIRASSPIGILDKLTVWIGNRVDKTIWAGVRNNGCRILILVNAIGFKRDDIPI